MSYCSGCRRTIGDIKFGQDLKLLMSFLPYPGEWCQVSPRATCLAPCSGLFQALGLGWGTYSCGLWGCYKLRQGFGTVLGVSGMVSSLFSPPIVYIPDFCGEHS